MTINENALDKGRTQSRWRAMGHNHLANTDSHLAAVWITNLVIDPKMRRARYSYFLQVKLGKRF
jgi:hypothetical protein